MAAADGVFIGPYDLSLSLGFPAPSPDPHPEVEKVIQSILASAHAKGKKWWAFSPLCFCTQGELTPYSAMFCTSGSQAAQRAKEGFDMVRMTACASFLQLMLTRGFLDKRRYRQHRDGGESRTKPRDRGGDGRGPTGLRLLSGGLSKILFHQFCVRWQYLYRPSLQVKTPEIFCCIVNPRLS